jgi:ABC-type transport system involved in multi-copper enzyme maturation permease subunit
MSSWAGIIEKIDDHLNPIIVKELRQVVRGKFFWGVLVLFLGFQCAVLSLSLADQSVSNNNVGAETLTFLFGILFLGCFAVIPLHSGFRFAKERQENSEELLFITTITPHSIIWGKFAASMAFILLIFSAFAPFMAMTFFLSGVDMPMMFLVLFLGLIVCAGGTILQIAIGSLARDGNVFNLLRGVGLFIQVSLFFSLTGMVSEILRYGASRTFGTTNFYGAIFTIAFFIICFAYFFYLAAAAVVSPAGTNIMRPVRSFLSKFWLMSLAVMIYWTSVSGKELIFGWGFAAVFLINIVFLIAISERDYLTRRVARELPQGTLGRRLGFLLSSGAAGGIAWCILMILATVGVIVAASMLVPMAGHISTVFSGFFKFSFGFTGYVLGYSLVAVFIRRVFLYNYVSARNTWGVALVVFAFFALAPMFLGVFVGARSELLMIGNPFAIASSRSEVMGLAFASLLTVVGVLLNAPWFGRQFREFHEARTINAARKNVSNG